MNTKKSQCYILIYQEDAIQSNKKFHVEDELILGKERLKGIMIDEYQNEDVLYFEDEYSHSSQIV